MNSTATTTVGLPGEKGSVHVTYDFRTSEFRKEDRP